MLKNIYIYIYIYIYIILRASEYMEYEYLHGEDRRFIFYKKYDKI